MAQIDVVSLLERHGGRQLRAECKYYNIFNLVSCCKPIIIRTF